MGDLGRLFLFAVAFFFLDSDCVSASDLGDGFGFEDFFLFCCCLYFEDAPESAIIYFLAGLVELFYGEVG